MHALSARHPLCSTGSCLPSRVSDQGLTCRSAGNKHLKFHAPRAPLSSILLACGQPDHRCCAQREVLRALFTSRETPWAGLLALRTVAISGTFALATSLAARSDLAHAAAHQICLQLWLASSLLADSLAVAAQTLLAQGVAAGRMGEARQVRPA